MRPSEEKAAHLLREAVDSIRVLESLAMRFHYIELNAEREVESSMKAELITKGDMYYMQMGDHYFISNGEVAWAYFSDVSEVHISAAEDTEASLSPTSLLESFTRDFRPVWIRSEQIKGRPADIIDLYPREAQMFHKFRIALYEDSRELAYMEAHDRQGGILLYEVFQYQPNAGADPDLFTFSPEEHPGIEIVDLR